MTFARSLGFAALAAAGVPLFVGVLGPMLGHNLALELYVIGMAVAYCAALAGTPRRAFVAAAMSAGLGLLTLILPLRLPGVVAAAALSVALVRSAFLHRAAGLRATTLELVLQTSGLLLAAYLAAASLISLALATWGYFLIQSLYFLVGGISLRRPDPVGDRSREKPSAGPPRLIPRALPANPPPRRPLGGGVPLR